MPFEITLNDLEGESLVARLVQFIDHLCTVSHGFNRHTVFTLLTLTLARGIPSPSLSLPLFSIPVSTHFDSVPGDSLALPFTPSILHSLPPSPLEVGPLSRGAWWLCTHRCTGLGCSSRFPLIRLRHLLHWLNRYHIRLASSGACIRDASSPPPALHLFTTTTTTTTTI